MYVSLEGASLHQVASSGRAIQALAAELDRPQAACLLVAASEEGCRGGSAACASACNGMKVFESLRYLAMSGQRIYPFKKSLSSVVGARECERWSEY